MGRWHTEVAHFAEAEMRRAEDVLTGYLRDEGFDGLPQARRRELDEDELRAAKLVPRRLYRGPVSVRAYLHRLSEEEREAWHQLYKEHRDLAWSLPILGLYWVDGQRNLLQIADLVELESGKRNMSFLTKYFEFLARMDLIEAGQVQ